MGMTAWSIMLARIVSLAQDQILMHWTLGMARRSLELEPFQVDNLEESGGHHEALDAEGLWHFWMWMMRSLVNAQAMLKRWIHQRDRRTS